MGSNSNGSRKNKAWNSDFWLEELSKLSDGHALKSDCWNTSSTILESDQEKYNVKDEWDSENDQEETQKEKHKEKETMNLDNIQIDWSLSDDDQEENNKVSSSSPNQQQQQQQQQEKEDLHVSVIVDKEKERSVDVLSSTSREKKLNGWSSSTSTSLVDIEPISMKLAPVLTPTPIISKKSLSSTTITTTITPETSQFFLIDNENEKDQKVAAQLSNKQFNGSLDFSLLDSGDDGNDEDEDDIDESNQEEEEDQEEGKNTLSISISNKSSITVNTESEDNHNDNQLSNLQQPSTIQDEGIGSQKNSETTVQPTIIQMTSTNQTKETHTSPSEKEQDTTEINPSVVQSMIVNHDDTSSIILPVEESNVEGEHNQSPTVKDDLTKTKSTTDPSAIVASMKSQQSIVPNQSSRPSSTLSSSSSSTTACMYDSADEVRTEPMSPMKLDLLGKEEDEVSKKQSPVDKSTLLEQEKKEEVVQQMGKDTTTKHVDDDEHEKSIEKEQLKTVQNSTVSNTLTDENQENHLVNEQGEILVKIDSLVLTDQEKSNEDKSKPESLANENKSSLSPSIEKSSIPIWAQSVEKTDERLVNITTTSLSPASSAKSSPKIKDQEPGTGTESFMWAQPTETVKKEKKEKKESDVMISTGSSETLTPQVEQEGTKFSMWAPPEKEVDKRLVATIPSSSKIEQQTPVIEQSKLEETAEQDQKQSSMSSTTSSLENGFSGSVDNPISQQDETELLYGAEDTKIENQGRESSCSSSSSMTQPIGTSESIWSSVKQTTIDMSKQQDEEEQKPVSLSTQQSTTSTSSIWSPAPPTKRITIQKEEQSLLSSTQKQDDSETPSTNRTSTTSPTIQNQSISLSFSTQPKVSTTEDSIWNPAPPAKSITIREEQKPLSPSKEQKQTATMYSSTGWSPAPLSSSLDIQQNQVHMSSSTQPKLSSTEDSIWNPAPPAKSITIREEQKALSPSKEQKQTATMYSSTGWSPAPPSSDIQQNQVHVFSSTQPKVSTTNDSIWNPAPPPSSITIREEQKPLSPSKEQNQTATTYSPTSYGPAPPSSDIQQNQVHMSSSTQPEVSSTEDSIWNPAPPAKSITIREEQKPLSPSKEQKQTATMYSSTGWSPTPPLSSLDIQQNQVPMSSSTQPKVSTTEDSIWNPAPPAKSVTIQEETQNPVSFTQQAASFEFSWDSSETAKTTSNMEQQEQSNPMTSTSATAVGTTTKKRERQQNIATDWSSSAASIWNSKTPETTTTTTTPQQTTSNTTPWSSSTSTFNQNNITTEKPFTFDYQLHKIQQEDSDDEDEDDEEESDDDDDDDDEEEYETGSEYNSDSDDDSVEQITINLASLVQAKKEEQNRKEPPVIHCTLSDLILGMKSEKIRNILDELSGKTSFSNVPSSPSITSVSAATQEEQPQPQTQQEQKENNIQAPSSVSSTASTSLSSASSSSSVVETKNYTHQQQEEGEKESTLSSLNLETQIKMMEKAKQFDNNLKLNAFARTFTPPAFVPKTVTTTTTTATTTTTTTTVTLSNIDYKQDADEEANVVDQQVFNYVSEQQYQQDQSIATVPLSYNQHLTPKQQADLLSAPKYFESVDQPQQQRQYTSLNTIQHYPKTVIPSFLSTPEALSQHPSLATRILLDNSTMIKSTSSVIGGIPNNNNDHSFPSTNLATNHMNYNNGGTLYFNNPEPSSLLTVNNENGTPLLKPPTSTKIKISAPDSSTDKFNISAPTFNPSNSKP
ncbi:hypothetical protein INT45_007473 [Circinella minor]|uniref:Uncharacterized protein n=1 Tax=Circinella minor TaxID=1195481 RepID=A0A8H7SFF2_9FUNG|nr:hypothetical protein INT45_007473 [Circinella minor]